MSQEGIPLPKSLRDQIIQNEELESLIDAGISHRQVLSELEDMTEDGYAYNRIVAIAEAGIVSTTASQEEQKEYQKTLNYCARVRELNGSDYDI